MYNSGMHADKKNERREKPRNTHVYLIIVLVVASLAILISTAIIYRNSLGAAEESLKLQALGIAASLEPSLVDLKGKENIFRDIITEASWEGIAFMALYDRSGMTLLHSNENLVGRKNDSPDIGKSADEEKSVFEHLTLGTGEEVFVLNYPIHARDSVRVLRLALHPYPAQDIIRQARLQAISIGIVVIAIWVMGFFFIRAVKRSEALSVMMAERERLAVIGEMAAVLAHEIRNPLGSIKGFAQYLSEQDTGGRAELGVIIDEARRLERLTEDLLHYARPSEVRAEEFNLCDLASEVEKLLHESQGKMASVTMKKDIPPDMVMVSDREKLKQILFNVLRNSAEAVGEGGLVELSVERSGSEIIIIVRDNGAGMDEETKSRAFTSFFTTKTTGTGLGLAIVDKLTTALEGRISLESEPACGTVFTMIFPAAIRG
jgi:two-component system sensor histidine kinase HydH